MANIQNFQIKYIINITKNYNLFFSNDTEDLQALVNIYGFIDEREKEIEDSIC